VFFQKVSRTDAECSGNTEEIQQPDVSLAPLDAADVRSVEVAPRGKLLLGDAEAIAFFSDPCPEGLQRRHGSPTQYRVPLVDPDRWTSPDSTSRVRDL
jgi:hypothetical protein